MKEFLLLLLFCKVNFSAIYKEQQNVPKGKIVYTGEEPSKLSCIQKSFFYKAEAVYDGRLCTCIKKIDNDDTDETLENGIQGNAYSLVDDIRSDVNSKEDKMPVSCAEIAYREPSAVSGLYTIRYNSNKAIQVYCDIDRNLEVFTAESGSKTNNGNTRKVVAAWMLVANVSFTKTISKDEAKQITKTISNNVDELKNAATKNFLFDLSQLLQFPINFQKIRIYCKTERTIHLLGLQDVVDYLIAKTDTHPASCTTFKRFTDDNSYLGAQCEKWSLQRWGYKDASVADRMYNWPFYVSNKYSFAISGNRIDCDDRFKLDGGTWQIFVR